VNEEMLSSKLGLHFGHYIAGSKSNLILHYHAVRGTVTLAHVVQLERWSRGLSVMLEKTLGVTLVTKLHAILLLEGDFNTTNKIVYGDWMIMNARDIISCLRRFSVRRIGWPTTERYAKLYSTISRGKPRYLRPSRRSAR
jgi:hypothetical protein